MANQPSPMVPNGNEKNPDVMDSSLHFERMSVPRDQNSLPEAPSHEVMDQSQADIVREKLISESAGIAPSAPTTQSSQSSTMQQAPTAQALASLTPEDQIHHLVNMAHTFGLDHAFKMANATNNAYVIDRFHDELVNRVLHNKQQSM